MTSGCLVPSYGNVGMSSFLALAFYFFGLFFLAGMRGTLYKCFQRVGSDLTRT